MKPVLVIGSNSFSGAYFISSLLDKSYEVIAVSRSAEQIKPLLPYRWNDQSYSKLQFHQLDINNDLEKIIALVKKHKIEYVFNFAAQSMVGQSWITPEDWFITNTVSTIKLHDKLRNIDHLTRYIHISTPEVYGNCSGIITENTQYNPSTPYAVSRAAADMSLATFYNAYNFPVVFTRAANVYGEGQQLYRIIPRTILFILLNKKLALHGGGNSTRSFIHMQDVSDATLKIALNGVNGEIYHISTDEMITVRSLVEKICSMMSFNFHELCEITDERLGKDNAYTLSSNKIKQQLNWHDEVSLENGISRTINWIKNNIDELKNTHFDYIHKK